MVPRFCRIEARNRSGRIRLGRGGGISLPSARLDGKIPYGFDGFGALVSKTAVLAWVVWMLLGRMTRWSARESRVAAVPRGLMEDR